MHISIPKHFGDSGAPPLWDEGMAAPNNKLLPHTLTNTSIFPAKRNKFPVIVTSVSLRTDSSNLMKAKKLHTDECYVCIMSFIRSVLALTLALALALEL